MHVNVVLPVEVAVLLPADAAQQEAVCKREGDVRDRDEQQDKGKHCGILTTKVDATETERKEDLGRPRYESGHDKGGNVKSTEMRACQCCVLLLKEKYDQPDSIYPDSLSLTSKIPTVVRNICFRAAPLRRVSAHICVPSDSSLLCRQGASR